MQKEMILFYILTGFLLYLNITAADKSRTLAGKHHKVSITCMDDNDCIEQLGIGYNCTNFICKCQEEEYCGSQVKAPKISAIVNVINEQCTSDDICKVKNSNCNDGYCRCDAGKVASEDKRRCLPISGGLDEKCEEDIQCMSKEPNSICRDKKCICNDIYNQDKFSCVPKVGLGGKCNSSVECSHIPNGRCGLIYCECELGYVPSEDKDQCLVIAKKSDDICEENVQCQQLYGKHAICNRNQCECDAVHTLVYNSDCPNKLNKYCETNDECKMYVDDLSMHCLRGTCTCSSLYEEIDGTCNGSNTITFSCILLCIIFFVNLI